MFVHARHAVGAVTFAERHAAQQQVLFEPRPLVHVGNSVFSDRAEPSPPFDERLVSGDEVLGEHCLWRRRIFQLSECLPHRTVRRLTSAASELPPASLPPMIRGAGVTRPVAIVVALTRLRFT